MRPNVRHHHQWCQHISAGRACGYRENPLNTHKGRRRRSPFHHLWKMLCVSVFLWKNMCSTQFSREKSLEKRFGQMINTHYFVKLSLAWTGNCQWKNFAGRRRCVIISMNPNDGITRIISILPAAVPTVAASTPLPNNKIPKSIWINCRETNHSFGQ